MSLPVYVKQQRANLFNILNNHTNPNMSADKTDETEALVIKLLKKMERKGKNIQAVLWKLMNYFENEQVDEKSDESNTVSLLYDDIAENVCKVGHTIYPNDDKHLSTEACVICGHRNSNNNKRRYQIAPNNQQILEFSNQYNIKHIPFGPSEYNKQGTKTWISRGWDKKWPLHFAAAAGDIGMIRKLCKNKNINVNQKLTDWADVLPIFVAARWGQLEVLIELIKHGANPIIPPDKSNHTPYSTALTNKHPAIIRFYQQYIEYVYNFDINEDTNLECGFCYNYDLYFNQHKMDGTMANYVYCTECTEENVKKIKMKQEDNEMIEKRIFKTIKENPSISVDTLCHMKDVKALHTILKEIIASGYKHAYCLWLLDIDSFKLINSYLTHAVADIIIQALGQVLKELELNTSWQWYNSGYGGVAKVHAFRQGGDEFGLVINFDPSKTSVLQQLYERIRDNINKIRLDCVPSMSHVTVSIGVCLGQAMNTYEEMMKQADLAAEIVKMDGKNGVAIYDGQYKKFYPNFSDIPL